MRYPVDPDRLIGFKNRILLAFLASTSLGLIDIAPALAQTSSVSIAVNAGTAMTPESTSGDDLATVQSFFAGANSPGEASIDPQVSDLQLKQVMTDLKMKRLRYLQTDGLCDLDDSNPMNPHMISLNIATDGNGGYTFSPQASINPGGCNQLDWAFAWSFNNNLTVHVALGAFMPPSFTKTSTGADYESAEAWPSTGRYTTYANKLVNYILTQAFNRGAQSVIFEVSNELDGADGTPEGFSRQPNPIPGQDPLPPDISQFKLKPLGPYGRWLWWIKPSSYTLKQWPAVSALAWPYVTTGLTYPYEFDMRRLDHGILPMHKIFADVIHNLRSSFPGKTIEIAGPAFTSASFLYFPGGPTGTPALEEIFLDQILPPAAPFHTDLDAFSFHFYGLQDYTKNPAAKFAYFDEVLTRVKAKAPGLKLFVSEWGPSVGVSVTGQPSDVNYSHKGAAWAAAFLTEALKKGVSAGSFLLLEDGQGEADSFLAQASLMHKHKDPSSGAVSFYPKPATNVFKMFAMMTGRRCPVTLSASGSNSNIGAFATSDLTVSPLDPAKKSAGVIVFNYDPTLVFANEDYSLSETARAETVSVEIDNLPFSDGTMVTVQRYLVDADHSNLRAFLNNPASVSPSLTKVDDVVKAVQNGKVQLNPFSLKLGVTYLRIQG
jgi:hypothetical protein